MFIGKIKVRPFHIAWSFSILIFALAVIAWIYFIYSGIKHELFNFAFINKYCKAKKNDLTYTEVIECYKEHLKGKYHTFKVMDTIFEFQNQLEYDNNTN